MANNQTPCFAGEIECPLCGYLNFFEVLKQAGLPEKTSGVKS